MTRSADTDDRIGWKLHPPEPAVARARNHEADVGRAVEDQRGDLVRMGIANADPSRYVHQRTEHERDDPRRERGVDRDDEVGVPIRPARGLECFLRERDAPLRVREQLLTGGRQHRPATGPLEERPADHTLEMADPLADRRLRDDELGRRPPEAALPHDGEEHLQVTEIQTHQQTL